MNLNWSLDDLYTEFGEEFLRDMDQLKAIVEAYTHFVEQITPASDPETTLIEYVQHQERIIHLSRHVGSYIFLTTAVDTQHIQANKYRDVLSQIAVALARPDVLFKQWLKSIGDIEPILRRNELLNTRAFALRTLVDQTQYMLSESEEVMYSNMQQYASDSWSKLFTQLTATLVVDYTHQGETTQQNLSYIRNLAFDADAAVRKDAYDAELKSYAKIEDTMALTLSNIKREVNYMTRMRGYASPLDKTLKDSRMSEKTLQAMLDAMYESLPVFHTYLRKKAQYLGYEGSLPFYELKAPVGKMNQTYTYEQSRDLIVENFHTFSKALGDFAAHAVNSRWLDVEPKHGKRGGAFCANLPFIGQSRIMLNFQGVFPSVKTMAHELGHGYHGQVIKDEAAMNWQYPMPLAETASIMCESILINNVLKDLDKEERMFILEQQIQANTAVIVDILSRYIFETQLFEATESVTLNKDELNDMMLNAQKTAYGDGLDHNALHPYMWINKSHYYRPQLSFYNFPYAFGLLFAKGLFSKYLEDKDAFVSKYDHMLSLTGKSSIEDVAASMDIDVTDIAFWRQGLKQVENDITELIQLMES